MVIKIIVTLFILFGLISTLLNVSILVFLVKTKKWNNQSKRLIMFSSIIFIANSTIGNTWIATFILMVYTHQTVNCTVHLVFVVIKNSFVIATAYKMVVIALDRYLHIIFLQNYANRFTRRRFNQVLVLYMTLVGLQTILFAIGIKVKSGNAYTQPLNILLFTTLITLYVLSLKRLRGRPSMEQNSVRSLTKPAYCYLTIYLVIYLPVILSLIHNSLTSKTNIELSMTLIATHWTVDLTGITSSIGFIIIDRSFREWIKTFFQRNNTVGNS